LNQGLGCCLVVGSLLLLAAQVLPAAQLRQMLLWHLLLRCLLLLLLLWHWLLLPLLLVLVKVKERGRETEKRGLLGGRLWALVAPAWAWAQHLLAWAQQHLLAWAQQHLLAWAQHLLALPQLLMNHRRL